MCCRLNGEAAIARGLFAFGKSSSPMPRSIECSKLRSNDSHSPAAMRSRYEWGTRPPVPERGVCRRLRSRIFVEGQSFIVKE